MICKNCKKIVEESQEIDGLCKNCHKSDEIYNTDGMHEESINKSKSYWKHALNWKYYIVPFTLGITIAYHFSQTGEQIISQFKIVNTIVGLVAAAKLKDKFLKEFFMFIVATVLSSLIMMAAYSSSTAIFEKIGGNSNKRQVVINNLLKKNKDLPIMFNDEIQTINYFSTNNKSITIKNKFINYTKKEVLEDYSNSISQFEKEMLQGEKEASCPNENVKKIFSTGLEMSMEYIGKNNNIIGIIKLNDEICKSYYK